MVFQTTFLKKLLSASFLACALSGSLFWPDISHAVPAEEGAPLPMQEGNPNAQSTVSLRYAVYIHGFHVLNADGAYGLHPWGYGVTSHLYTVGLASWFIKINLYSTVEGKFENGKALPISYDSHGFSRGKNRALHLDFSEEGPKVKKLLPEHDEEREPLPVEQLKHSIDMLSGLALLFHTLDTTGNCHLSGTLFDGLRLTHIEAHGPEIENIPQSNDIYAAGPAQKCSFTGAQIAGFVKDSGNNAELAKARPGAAWFIHVKNIGIIPVRVEFDHPKLGKITMIMQEKPQTAIEQHSH